jgi:hypothetical protein
MPGATGIQVSFPITNKRWIPACAGMTDGQVGRLLKHVNDLRTAQSGMQFAPHLDRAFASYENGH